MKLIAIGLVGSGLKLVVLVLAQCLLGLEGVVSTGPPPRVDKFEGIPPLGLRIQDPELLAVPT